MTLVANKSITDKNLQKEHLLISFMLLSHENNVLSSYYNSFSREMKLQ